MIEAFLTHEQILELMPRREQYVTDEGKMLYLIDPRLQKYLLERGFDFNKPIKPLQMDTLGGILFSQDEAVHSDFSGRIVIPPIPILGRTRIIPPGETK